MRTSLLAAAAAILVTLSLATPGHGACGSGDGSCEPALENARQKMSQLLDSAFLSPHLLTSFEKLDGRSLETRERKVYEMRVLAVLSYSGDRLRCRIRLCPQLHNYLVEIDDRSKTAKVAGWLFFERTAKGWH